MSVTEETASLLNQLEKCAHELRVTHLRDEGAAVSEETASLLGQLEKCAHELLVIHLRDAIRLYGVEEMRVAFAEAIRDETRRDMTERGNARRARKSQARRGHDGAVR